MEACRDRRARRGCRSQRQARSARAAHANRHARAISGAATTGRKTNIDKAPRPPPSSRKRASRLTPSERADAPGTPTTAVQPSLPVNEADHGRLAMTATATAPNAATAIVRGSSQVAPDEYGRERQHNADSDQHHRERRREREGDAMSPARVARTNGSACATPAASSARPRSSPPTPGSDRTTRFPPAVAAGESSTGSLRNRPRHSSDPLPTTHRATAPLRRRRARQRAPAPSGTRRPVATCRGNQRLAARSRTACAREPCERACRRDPSAISAIPVGAADVLPSPCPDHPER